MWITDLPLDVVPAAPGMPLVPAQIAISFYQ